MSSTTHRPCSIADEDLAAFVAGDLAETQRQALAAHTATCEHCTRRLKALHAADTTLAQFMQHPIPDAVAQRVLGRLAQSTPAPAMPEILTLREAAAFLRITEQDLEEMLDELPVFELGGQLRIRTQRLRQWIEQRELTYQRNAFRTRALRIARGAWSKGMAS